MDRLSPAARSENMRRVPSKNTLLEQTVRKAIHALGYRYRLHRRDLPGTPDIVLPRFRLAIFVHGCFWHGHEGCPAASVPKSNVEFWAAKLSANVARDRAAAEALKKAGWNVEVIWGCQLRKKTLRSRLDAILPSK